MLEAGRHQPRRILNQERRALQIAEKLDFVLAFGWPSAGVPSTPGFGVMGWSGSPLR